jgi:RNA polymerase sigma-70 factor, ECF subfamily
MVALDLSSDQSQKMTTLLQRRMHRDLSTRRSIPPRTIQQRRTEQIFMNEALPHVRALFAGALRLTRCTAEAEDLVQETFMKAFRAFDQFEPGTNCRAWLFRIQKNTFINRYRRKKREFEIINGAERTTLEHTFMHLASKKASLDPQNAMADKHFSDEVREALSKMPPHFRDVVLLSDIEDLSYKEVAAQLDIPVGTVMSRLFRGRRMLRDQLQDFAVQSGIVKAEAPMTSAMDLAC